jgi:hypothetical protein
MLDSASDYKMGPGRPPLHTRFKKGRSGDPLRAHARLDQAPQPPHITRLWVLVQPRCASAFGSL